MLKAKGTTFPLVEKCLTNAFGKTVFSMRWVRTGLTIFPDFRLEKNYFWTEGCLQIFQVPGMSFTLQLFSESLC